VRRTIAQSKCDKFTLYYHREQSRHGDPAIPWRTTLWLSLRGAATARRGNPVAHKRSGCLCEEPRQRDAAIPWRT
jgi:hypothetical protein